MGQADCTGIPQDAATHSLEFGLDLSPGEDLGAASFTHRFDGYSNASLADSIHFEIDHDLDGSFQTIASWTDATAPKALSPAGPFDLSSFNGGRAASVRFRFRFQSAAQWVGGPNNAPGWDLDDFRVDVTLFGTCDMNSKLPPGNVGNTLAASMSGGDLLLIWSAAPGAGGYPVELTSFTGPVMHDGVLLNWTTATELNNLGFEIERSTSVQSWEKIGYVPGFGTTTEPKSYSFLDQNVTSGSYAYRLKQLDFDGTISYSDEIEVVVELTPDNFELFQNYPNRFNPSNYHSISSTECRRCYSYSL